MSSPTYWSQPNQQVVRNGEPVGIVSDDPDPQSEGKTKGGFDPGEHTVEEVNEYLDKHPSKRDDIVAAEAAGKNRVGIVGG